jgi:hypothetical protein
MQIGSLIRRAALHHGDAPCLMEGERRLSYRDFDKATDRFGNVLLAANKILRRSVRDRLLAEMAETIAS